MTDKRVKTDPVAAFFEENPPPPNLEQVENAIRKFITHHRAQNRKIVLVTSGGTTVPLEKNTVRFIDNFSGGGRGSSSTEWFIENGYAVLFLYRRHSLQPYARSLLMDKEHTILDYVCFNEQTGVLEVSQEQRATLKPLLLGYHHALSNGLLEKIVFQTVYDYMFYLRVSVQVITAPLIPTQAAAKLLDSCGEDALVYSAAAVSDFFIPTAEMATHKIQSSSGGLNLELKSVPKMLAPLCRDWCPKAFVVTFKLETDENILTFKATKSLNNYNQQMVVGNLLQNHRDQVKIFYKPGLNDTTKDPFVIKRTQEEIATKVDIEKYIIAEVSSQHKRFIASKST